MPAYYLRRIEPALWKRVKARAGAEGRSLRFILCELLRVYAEHGYRVVETFETPGGKKK